jgi:ParB/RepB/Spo0J family partition protein
MSAQPTAPTNTSLVFVPIPLGQIRPSKTNPRKNFDKVQLEELAQSIREKGVLQPILVRPDHKVGDYELVAGERRYRAAKDAGLQEIPAVVRELTDIEVIEVQVIENLQRTDLHPLEEAEGYRQLMAKKYDVAKIAARTGRSVKYVYDRVKLLSLTKDAQKAFLAGEFTAGHAVILARLKPADQERAMNLRARALFDDEDLLFTPDEEDELGPADQEPRKARSVRELQGWVDEHVKLEATEVLAEPMLFPETAITLDDATELREKVVRITHDTMTPEAAKDGPKVILGRSWKRADGKAGSKQCDRSVIGIIVIGAGRGEALRVCVDKKGCSLHWGDLIKARKKTERAVTKAAATGEDRETIRRKAAATVEAVRKAERERWEKAWPTLLEAFAAIIKKAPAGGGSAVGKYVLEIFKDDVLYGGVRPDAAKRVPLGKTAEDLVRHMAFGLLQGALEERRFDDGEKGLISLAKSFGVDARKILDEASPAGGEARCRKCGCTEKKACDVGGEGCSWVEKPDPKTKLGLCSACAPKAGAAKAKKKAGKK